MSHISVPRFIFIYLLSQQTFYLYIYIYFKLFILYWDIADEQCHDSFRGTVKRLSHAYTFCTWDVDPMTPLVGNEISAPSHCSELGLALPV